MDSSPSNLTRARARLAAVTLLVLCAAVMLWRFTPLADLATPDRLLGWLETLRESRWSPAVMPLIFVVGGLVFFPLTFLIAATALLFEPLLAFAVAFTGTLANAVVTYAVSARLLRGTARAAIGPLVSRLEAALETSGVIAVAIIRTVPIAPFTAVNLAAGLLNLKLRDYIVGTAIGVVPGIAALTLFGHQLHAVLRQPTWSSLSSLAAVLLGWIALSLLLQYAVNRWQGKARASAQSVNRS